jgi:beta-glucanase (GH16 family)
MIRALGLRSSLPVLVGCARATLCAAGESDGWELVWRDDFDVLDLDKWSLTYQLETSNDSLHAYLPQQVRVRDGTLVILATNIPYGGRAYRSGQVISRRAFEHGRFEVRGKLPGTVGTWPALWLLPDVRVYAWPTGGEIDIVEHRGHDPTRISGAFHYGADVERHAFTIGDYVAIGADGMRDFREEFHVYAVEWSENALDFYIDDVRYFEVLDADVGGSLRDAVKPMRIMLDMAVGGTFVVEPDATSSWPQELLIDYVRVYAPALERNRALVNGSFESRGGSMAGWGIANGASAHVRVVRGGAHGTHSLELAAGDSGVTEAAIDQSVAVTGGATIVARASALVTATRWPEGALLTMQVLLLDANGERLDEALHTHSVPLADAATNPDEWARKELRLVAPDEAATARLTLTLENVDGRDAQARVDDIHLHIGVP